RGAQRGTCSSHCRHLRRFQARCTLALARNAATPSTIARDAGCPPEWTQATPTTTPSTMLVTTPTMLAVVVWNTAGSRLERRGTHRAPQPAAESPFRLTHLNGVSTLNAVK